VGPTAEGLIPGPSVERLQEMGAWLATNGEAIYGSELLPHYTDGAYVRYTYTGGDFIYAVALKWPGTQLALQYVEPTENSEIHLLGYDDPLEWTVNDLADVVITLPDELQDEGARPNPYAYVFKIRVDPAMQTDVLVERRRTVGASWPVLCWKAGSVRTFA
jgi:alpha-L-fucosidase